MMGHILCSKCYEPVNIGVRVRIDDKEYCLKCSRLAFKASTVIHMTQTTKGIQSEQS